jgi:hypothetical protein
MLIVRVMARINVSVRIWFICNIMASAWATVEVRLWVKVKVMVLVNIRVGLEIVLV